MIPILVDERRLAAGLDGALARQAANGTCEFITPALLLERLTGVRVVGDAERRAIIRRIAAARDDIGIARHITASASFAARVAAAIDDPRERGPFESIVEHYRTLIAFAGVLDVPDALHRALSGERRPAASATLRIDSVLLGEAERSFAWRRLCAAAGITLDPLDLGPVAAPAIDPLLVAGIEAMLRFAASGADGDARAAIVSSISGVELDDARALLTASIGRIPLLDQIDRGSVALSSRSRQAAGAFAYGLRSVARAYAAPDADATSVLSALGAAFTLEHPSTVAALIRVARDFDRARTFGSQWEAAQRCAEFGAEFAAAARPAPVPFTPAPAVAPAAETPGPVPMRKLHFSASSLNAYAECARKWYFRYACAAVEDKGSSASFYGTAFHAALEDFHLKYSRVDGVPANELATFLDACVGAAFERYRGQFDAPVEYELQRRRARRTAKRYLRWLVARAQTAPFTVIGCEMMTEISLEGHEFVGYIDRLDRDDRTGGVTVIDYKTGSIAMSAAEYRDNVARFAEFQLPFYYWARTAAGDRVTKLALIPLKDALLDVVPVELDITPGDAQSSRGGWRANGPRGTISIGELERARTKMIEYASLLASGTIAAYPATDAPEACRYCAYRSGCRERPFGAAERFGR